MIDIHKFWAAVLNQDTDAIWAFFAPTAYVNWHNTNKHFLNAIEHWRCFRIQEKCLLAPERKLKAIQLFQNNEI